MKWYNYYRNYIKYILGMRPDSTFVAGQLRNPNGFFAEKITGHMNRANKGLLGLTLSCMVPEKGDRILEIGFGNGRHFKDLLSEYPGISLCGLDHSPEVHSMAGKFLAAEKGMELPELKHGSSDAIPWPDNSFHGVFCNNVIYFWESPEAHLREVLRVLKPGAFLFCGFRTRSSMEKLPFTAHGFHMYEIPEWREVMANCGFFDIRHRTLSESRELNPSLKIELESACVFGKKKPGSLLQYQ